MAELFRRAGVDKTSVIRVTGRGGLATLLWLCRRGYEQVGYVRHGPCPTDRCDLLLVLEGDDAGALAETLEQGPHLRNGGVLVVQTAETGAGEGADAVDQLLGRCGFRVEEPVHGRHRDLHFARRDTALAWKRAA